MILGSEYMGRGGGGMGWGDPQNEIFSGTLTLDRFVVFSVGTMFSLGSIL